MRIVAVDHLSGGIHNYARLRKALDACDAEIVLFHLGSLRGGQVKRVEIIDGILCVDIGAFRGMTLDGILGQLQPDLVLLLNVFTLLERSVILTCRRMNIPTVYLQHGIMPHPDVLPDQCEMVRVHTSLMEYFRKMPRYSRLFRMYLEARRFRIDAGFWKVVWAQFHRPRLSMFYPRNVVELRPTRSLVFYESDAEFLWQTHKIAASEIRVVGNPELDATFERLSCPISNHDKRRLRKSLGLTEEGLLLFYPDETFAASHLYGWDARYADERLEELLEICAGAGWQLLIRPRSFAAVNDFRRKIGKCAAAVSRDLSIVDATDISDCVFGTVSSVLENALVLHKPILVPLWYLNNRAQDSPYLRTGSGIPVASPAELRATLGRSPWMKGERVPNLAASDEKVIPKPAQACEMIVAELISLARRSPTPEALMIGLPA